jgi:two-component system osmolarity sensor histidine kinase EnvZ
MATTVDAPAPALRGPRAGWRRVTRTINGILPKGLFARALIIIIAPTVLLQALVAFVFMERHWQLVTAQLSSTVVGEIAAIVDMLDIYPQDSGFATITRIAGERMGLNIAVLPPEPLPPIAPKPFFSPLDRVLSQEISSKIGKPFWIDTVGRSSLIEIRIQLDHNVLRVFAPRAQAYVSNSLIFIWWMVATSVVLLAIAIIFLRNHIRPILDWRPRSTPSARAAPCPIFHRAAPARCVRRPSPSIT